MTISCHVFRFLIGEYLVLEIRYIIKERNENDKNINFLMLKNKKISRNYILT